MGQNLIKAGHLLTVWARRPESAASLVDAGASYQPVPRELASNDVIIDMLQDLTQLEPLLTGPDGLLAGVTEPTLLVVSSTVAPQDVRTLAARVDRETNGLLSVVDAPAKPRASQPMPLIPVAEIEELLQHGDAAAQDARYEPVPSGFYDELDAAARAGG